MYRATYYNKLSDCHVKIFNSFVIFKNSQKHECTMSPVMRISNNDVCLLCLLYVICVDIDMYIFLLHIYAYIYEINKIGF